MTARLFRLFTCSAALFLLVSLTAELVAAQTAPETKPEIAKQMTAPAPDLWRQTVLKIRQGQMKLQRSLATAAREMKTTESLAPTITLALIGLLYGVLHAIGPGHGKIVIASYLLAEESRIKRGVGLAFLASAAQAISAIAMVGVFAFVFDMSRLETTAKAQWLETVSYGFIAILGLWMIFSALRGKGCTHSHDHGAADYGTPAPASGTFKQLWAPVLAIGIRPCSGAIIILLFTLAQGVFLAGIGATFAMALGTATTVAALAIFTVVARRMALRLVQSNGIWENHMSRGLALLGASAVLVFGILLLFASIGRNNPFL